MMRMAVRPKVLKRGLKLRDGRGFSREEMKKAGLSPSLATKLGFHIDSRRKTVHSQNVTILELALKGKLPRKRRKSKSQAF